VGETTTVLAKARESGLAQDKRMGWQARNTKEKMWKPSSRGVKKGKKTYEKSGTREQEGLIRRTGKVLASTKRGKGSRSGRKKESRPRPCGPPLGKNNENSVTQGKGKA